MGSQIYDRTILSLLLTSGNLNVETVSIKHEMQC